MVRARTIFHEFLKAPNKVGAVVPSSRYLATAMLDQLNWDTLKNVVEYGPGTGAISKYLLQRVGDHQNLFAVELNESFIPVLNDRLPELQVFNESVGDIRQICDRQGIDWVDGIISGLPWTAFPESLQEELLSATLRVLAKGGQFITFAYLHGLPLQNARRFRSRLKETFSKVTISPVVWRNIPPAIFYSCRK
ncbi:MAG: ribosomal RNA adenine dimethylase domain-containing protein [Planctomycetaceae bacterium]|nr:ribosomal RNA adenine dimethylase domain-containing protein [Planctomycetaceae bacterium]